MPQAGGYYDIDAILATQQKLPCTFRYDVPGAGHLESEDSHDVRSLPGEIDEVAPKADTERRSSRDRRWICHIGSPNY